MLNTLEHAGWVERTAHGAFRLTLKAFRLGSVAVESLDVRREAAPIMTALATTTGDSVYLVVSDAARAVCLQRVDVGNAVRVADLNDTDRRRTDLGPTRSRPMPLVRIDVEEGRSPEELRLLADTVQQVMLDVLAAPPGTATRSSPSTRPVRSSPRTPASGSSGRAA